MLTKRQKALLNDAKFKRQLGRINNTEKRKARIRKNASKAFGGLAKFFHRATGNLGAVATNLANSEVGKNTKISYP